VGAKALVVAHVRRFGDLYAIDLKLLDPTGNRYLFGALEQGLGKESVPAIIDRLSERVRSGLHEDAADIKSTSRPVALSTTASLEAYRHFFAAEDLWLRSIEVKKAFEEYQRAIALDPEFALAHLRLARNSDEGDAKDHLDRALQLTGRLSDTDLCRARALHSMFEGREQQALSTLQDCAARYPTDESTVEETGDWAFHQGRFDIADQYLGRVLANHPMHAEAYNHQVFIWFVRGEIPRILAAASAQLKQSHDLETYEHFVWSQWIAGKSDVAEATVGEMERLFPGEWGPLRIRQLLSLHAGDTEKAEALLARPEFATLDRAEQDYVRLVIDWSRGRFRHAFTVFDEMSRAFPDYGPALILWKARALAARGDRDGARRLAADVLPAEARQVKTNPAYRRQFIAKVLHGLLCWLGEADEALAMVEGQQIPAAQHSDLATRLDAARARKEGRLADEIAAYEKLVAGDPVWRPTMLMRLGVLYLDAHQHRKAVDALRSGLSSMSVVRQRFRYAPPSPVDPEFVFNWYRLAKALEGAGDRIAALDAYRRVLRMWSDADADAPELIETRLRVAELENAR
jgi:tetratricopeptide (TPR) repeat protein